MIDTKLAYFWRTLGTNGLKGVLSRIEEQVQQPKAFPEWYAAREEEIAFIKSELKKRGAL